KDLRLQREKGAARVDQVHAGQVVFERDFLGAQVLLHREWKVCPAFDRGIVGDDHRLTSVNGSDAGDDASGRGLAVIEAVGGERGELEERGARIEQGFDAL